jgi:predicted ArsR family transcriptional regulator
MANIATTSDNGLLDLLRQNGPLGISALAAATKVTPTAVRQRLNRLMDQGLIEREAARAGRGRPSHHYSITPRGQRSAGTNFADLAVVLWQEIRTVKDMEVRRGLFHRLAKKMADLYQRQVHGTTPEERMRSVASIFSDRGVPLVVETGPQVVETGPRVVDSLTSLPILTALACPYPELAEQDRGICAMERMLFSELVGRDVRLAECRLDGDRCCRFAMS